MQKKEKKKGSTAVLNCDPLQKRGQWPETIKEIGPEASAKPERVGEREREILRLD